KDSPSRRLSRALFETVYREHPYRHPVLGSIESVRGFDRDAVWEFFQNFYRPENTTLVVVGDRESEELLDRCAQYFSEWRGVGEMTRPQRPAEPAQTDLRIVPVAHSVKEARASIAWRIPSIEHDDIAALDLLSVVLGHGESSRLAVETLRKHQLVNAASAYAYTPKDPGIFVMTGTMRSENSKAALLSMAEQVVRLQDAKLEPGELEKARVVMLSESAYQRETVQGQARKLGFYETVCGDFEFEHRYETALRALNASDVQAAAQTYLSAAPTVVLLDEAPEIDGLESAFATQASSSSTKTRKVAASDGVARVELDSGAKVLVLKEASPVVAYRAVALGGLRWESEALIGLSYLLTACWGRAVEGMNQEQFAARAASLGGGITAFSGRNTLGLRGEFIRERWRQGLDLCVDAAVASLLDEAELERERALALERIRNRSDNPAGVAFDSFLSALFPTHAYGRRLVGTE
ncbi:MAG: insulinase family protein, partial [Myxococcota bacterium]